MSIIILHRRQLSLHWREENSEFVLRIVDILHGGYEEILQGTWDTNTIPSPYNGFCYVIGQYAFHRRAVMQMQIHSQAIRLKGIEALGPSTNWSRYIETLGIHTQSWKEALERKGM